MWFYAMVNIMGGVVSLLDPPVYTFREVDRLLGLNQGTARRWIDGYRRGGRSYPPIVRESQTGDAWVTWGEFTETRLLSEYRDVNDIRIQKLRIVVDELRREFHQRYPLAYARPFVQPHGREIVMRAQRDAGLDEGLLVVVRTGQLVLSPRAERFYGAATFESDPAEPDAGPVAVRFQADPRYSEITIDPERKSGRPTVAGRGILVTTLRDMVDAGDRVEDVAEWYDLSVEQVQQAVDFTATHNLVA
jgi:uncharacterized protein (DUF433 family)